MNLFAHLHNQKAALQERNREWLQNERRKAQTAVCWGWVATPLPLIGSVMELPGYGRFPALDTFGVNAYQGGVFWHDHYKRWVIGIDVFTPEPLHYLECNGRIL